MLSGLYDTEIAFNCKAAVHNNQVMIAMDLD